MNIASYKNMFPHMRAVALSFALGGIRVAMKHASGDGRFKN